METALVTAKGKSYELHVDEAAAHKALVETIPYEASSKQPWYLRLSPAAIASLPKPPPGNPRDWL